MCNIFAWVDVGLMGAAWVFFIIVQVRFVVLQSLRVQFTIFPGLFLCYCVFLRRFPERGP